MPERISTSLNRPWVFKTALFTLGLCAFGLWGLYDALILYPNRGIDDASFKQKVYLEAAQRAVRLDLAGIDDPGAEAARLRARASDLARAVKEDADLQSKEALPGPEGDAAKTRRRTIATSVAEAALLRWFDSLSLVGRLTPAYTAMKSPAPAETLAALKAKWDKTSPPKELALYDIPLQWSFVAVGFAGTLYLLFRFLSTKRRVYFYEPEAQRLHLPGGKSLTPADIQDFDKRKWDKFFIILHLKDGSPPLTLDLYPHHPLEEWILEMERTAFPDRAEPAADAASDATDAAARASSTQTAA